MAIAPRIARQGGLVHAPLYPALSFCHELSTIATPSVRPHPGMRIVDRQALVPYTPAQMYTLVNGIARYPEFVPWVPEAVVHEESAIALVATLTVARAGARVSLTTRNTMLPDARIDMALVDGPLRRFAGRWEFLPIVEAGEPPLVRGCRILLHVEYEFGNAAIGLLLGPLFESTWNSLVDAFVARAHAVYRG